MSQKEMKICMMSESLLSLATHLKEIEKEERTNRLTGVLTIPCQLEGRVFDHLVKYSFLPLELQAQAEVIVMYLLSSPDILFTLFQFPWYHKVIHSNPRVKKQPLLNWIQSFLEKSYAMHSTRFDAIEIVETLVLMGFITLNKRKWAFYTSYTLVSPLQAPESVWNVTEGAIRAGFVNRNRPPFLRRICQQEKVYLVVNKTKHRVYFFSNDVAQNVLGSIYLVDTMVQYQISSQHTLKLWRKEHKEYLFFHSSQDTDAWLLSLLDAGASYNESHPRVHSFATCHFYDLQDRDANGDDIWFRQFQGQVVLVVNTATNDPEAGFQFPQLVGLMSKYKRSGLVILACPCDQFGALNHPSLSDRELAQYLDHIYKVQFPILSKRPVNGPNGRPLFLFLKNQLIGRFGPFIEWNFTKFLIDRYGNPYQRYGTHILPFEMDKSIQKLLFDTWGS